MTKKGLEMFLLENPLAQVREGGGGGDEGGGDGWGGGHWVGQRRRRAG